MVAWPLASNWTVMSLHTAVGATVSTTVTVPVQVELLPLLSVTVSVTVLVPILPQSKLVWLRRRLAMPEASVLPLSSWTPVMVAWPLASNWTVMFWQTAVGGTESTTVTVAVQVEVLPLLSVTVRVTVLVPILPQSKLVWLRRRLAMPEASVLPLSSWTPVMVAWPLASNWTVMFWQTAVGGTESTTVTVAVQVEVLPLLSVTVRVTVLVPMVAQSKLVWLRLRLAMPEASVLPLSSWTPVMVAWPLASNWTVMFWQTAVGGTESTTVTVAVQVEVLPLLSVTVRVTVLVPMVAQSKLVWLRLRLAMPEASVLPLSSWTAVMVAWPLASNWTVMFWQTAVGGTESTTVTVAVQVEVLPLLSVTVRVTVLVPMVAQSKLVWLRLRLAMPEASVLPLSSWTAVMVAWPLASNWTVMFWQTAVGGTVSITVTVAVQVELLPLLSVTVSVTVLVPMVVQSKLVWLRLRLAMPEASVLPLSSWTAVMVTWPLASNWTVMFWQTAVGGTESTTVTVAVQVEVLPLLSVTVRVTRLVPTLLTSKLVLSRLRLAMPQASLLPLSI